MEFKQYPSYKNSGVEWLGDVPEHWKLKPIWSLFKRVKRVDFVNERLLSVYRDYGVIPKDSRDDNNNRASEDLTPYQLVCPNDLVINKMKAWQGSIAISQLKGIVSPAYYIYQPKAEYCSKYIHFLIRSVYYIQSYKNYSKGIRVNQWDLEHEAFTHIDLLIPSIDEQQKIVSFLDTETARIDKLISKQEKLIKLLEEQRKSIISYAVTKGLNPNAPMKDSGVEWLGEVPEHWDVYPFWHLFKQKEITNKTKEKLLSVYLDRGVILHSEGGGMVHKPAENLEKYQLVEVNDFVMNNQQAWRGSVGVSPHQGIVSPAYLIFKPNKELNSQFSKYQLRDKYLVDQFMISSLSVGTIQRQIKNHLLRVIQVPTPPLNDQQKIVSFLDTETTRIDKLISKQEKLIQKLKEYRSSIISHAVTGKIDVREWVA